MIITENPFVAVEEGDVKNGPSTLGTPPTVFGFSVQYWYMDERTEEQTVAKHPAPNLLYGSTLCRLHSLSLYTPEQRIVFTFLKAMRLQNLKMLTL